MAKRFIMIEPSGSDVLLQFLYWDFGIRPGGAMLFEQGWCNLIYPLIGALG